MLQVVNARSSALKCRMCSEQLVCVCVCWLQHIDLPAPAPVESVATKPTGEPSTALAHCTPFLLQWQELQT